MGSSEWVVEENGNGWTRLKRDIGDTQVGQVGDSRAGAAKRREHHTVTPSTPDVRVRCIKDSLDLLPGEEPDERALEALQGNRGNAFGSTKCGAPLAIYRIRVGKCHALWGTLMKL
jgi:hypothetical protein